MNELFTELKKAQAEDLQRVFANYFEEASTAKNPTELELVVDRLVVGVSSNMRAANAARDRLKAELSNGQTVQVHQT